MGYLYELFYILVDPYIHTSSCTRRGECCCISFQLVNSLSPDTIDDEDQRDEAGENVLGKKSNTRFQSWDDVNSH